MTPTGGAVANSSPWPASWACSNIISNQCPFRRRHGTCFTRFNVGILCAFSLASPIPENSEQTQNYFHKSILQSLGYPFIVPTLQPPGPSHLSLRHHLASTRMQTNASSCFSVGFQRVAISFLFAEAWRRISLHSTMQHYVSKILARTHLQHFGSFVFAVFAVVHIVYEKCSANMPCK